MFAKEAGKRAMAAASGAMTRLSVRGKHQLVTVELVSDTM
jgi:hypothetical protein